MYLYVYIGKVICIWVLLERKHVSLRIKATEGDVWSVKELHKRSGPLVIWVNGIVFRLAGFQIKLGKPIVHACVSSFSLRSLSYFLSFSLSLFLSFSLLSFFLSFFLSFLPFFLSFFLSHHMTWALV